MATRKESAKHTLIYPAHQFDPEDLLNFAELDWFVRNWDDLALTDDDLTALQVLLMVAPRGGKVVRGTKGLRKMRFAPLAEKRGKSGAYRVCYVYFEKYGFVVLVTVYAKGEKDDLSAAERNTIRKTIERIETSLETRFGF